MGVRPLLLVAVALTACGAAKQAASVPRAYVATCDTTRPGEAPRGLDSELARTANTLGNGELWAVGLPQAGVMGIDPANVAKDGSLYTKLAWWRRVKGDLHITGERLDAPAPPLRADVPAGYPETGFQPTGLTFPAQGCWKVTGRIGDGKALAFVTLVVKR